MTRLTAPAPILDSTTLLAGPRFTIFRAQGGYVLVDDATRREYATWTLKGARRLVLRVLVGGMPAWGGRPRGTLVRRGFVEEVAR